MQKNNSLIQSIDIRDAFFDQLYEIAREDESVIFMTADMGAFSLERFRRDFPSRFINVGVSEQNMITVATGLSMEKKKPFIYAIIPFITLRCLEQIKVDLCLMNLPVTIVGAGAGFTYSNDGPTHHAIEDVSVMRALPGMTILNPSEQMTARFAALSGWRAAGPVYVRLDKGIWPRLYPPDKDFSQGLALLREGKELLIIATGCMTHTALQLAEAIAASGIHPGVVDLFRLKPIPEALIDIANEYEKVITLEEHTIAGAMGSGVLEIFSEKGLTIPVKRLGVEDIYPSGYGDRDWIQQSVGLDFRTLYGVVNSYLETSLIDLFGEGIFLPGTKESKRIISNKSDEPRF